MIPSVVVKSSFESKPSSCCTRADFGILTFTTLYSAMTSFRLFGREAVWLGSVVGSFCLVQVQRGSGGGSKVLGTVLLV